VLASHAHVIKRVVDLHLAREAPVASLAQLAAYQDARASVDATAPVQLFINPRAWDASLARGLAEDEGAPRRGRQLVHEAWTSLEYAAVSLRLEPQVRLEAFWKLDCDRQAAELPEVLGSLSGAPRMQQHIPADCLAAAFGRLDITRLIGWLRRPAPLAPAARQRSAAEVVWSLLDGTFQGIGPSFAAFVSAAPPESDFPLDAAAATEILHRAGAATSHLKPAEAIKSLLEAGVAAAGNTAGKPPEVKSQHVEDFEVTTVSNLPNVPAGVQPSFAFRDKTMLIGTSPAVVQRSAGNEDSLSSALSALLGPRLTAPTQAVYLNFARLCRLLADPERIVEALAPKEDAEREKTRRGLKDLSLLLELADAAAAAAQVEPTGIRFSAAVATEP
jgi:hypothetical protein